MAKKRTKISGQMLFTWLVLAGFILLFAPQDLTNRFQLAFAHVFRQPLSIGRNFALSLQAPPSASATVTSSKYKRLRNHLSNIMQSLHMEREKVEVLSGLRDRSVWEGVRFVLADVITACSRGPHNQIIINRGKNDGVRKGNVVVGEYSVIGTVEECEVRTAKVRLVTDIKSMIPIKVDDEDVETIMKGNGNNSAKVLMVARKYKIKIGDVVYAKKKPGFLEVPMVVGTVTKCKMDDDNPLLWDITVKPACEINRLKNVAVIVANP
jgi:rod shape-determining protein MreC